MSASPQAAPEPKIHRYPCPGCAASLLFEPKDGCLTCPYCGRSEQIPAAAAQVEERSYEAYLRERPEQMARLSAGAQEIACKSCGAVVTFEPPAVAGECPFCAVKIVTQAKSADPLLAPEGTLPFRVTGAQATSEIRRWLASRWFAPDALKRLARPEAIQGVYLPYWTYDAYTTSHYTGERGEYYYETETYTETDSEGRSQTRTREVRRTRWYPVSGTVARWFDDVLVLATKWLPPQRLDSLEPWDLAELKPYDPAFLAGYQAQRYQVGLADGFERARQKMAGVIRGDVAADIGGDEQRVHDVATSYSGVTFKHLLLPVWISAYRFQQKAFQVMVNARTAEVQGARPYSFWKIAFLVLAIVLAILIIASLSR